MQVWPSKYSAKEKPWFLFTVAYWRGPGKDTQRGAAPLEGDIEGAEMSKSGNIEPLDPQQEVPPPNPIFHESNSLFIDEQSHFSRATSRSERRASFTEAPSSVDSSRRVRTVRTRCIVLMQARYESADTIREVGETVPSRSGAVRVFRLELKESRRSVSTSAP